MASYNASYREIMRGVDLMKNILETNNYELKFDKDLSFKIKVLIKDYKVIDDKVVIVTFVDETTEKAVCSPEDKFDLERAIEICVCKKIFGGTKVYNNAIKDALKQVAAIDKKKKAEADEAERIAKKKAKEIDRKNKRKERKRQEQIDIQAEAYLKALKMHDDYVANDSVDVAEG